MGYKTVWDEQWGTYNLVPDDTTLSQGAPSGYYPGATARTYYDPYTGKFEVVPYTYPGTGIEYQQSLTGGKPYYDPTMTLSPTTPKTYQWYEGPEGVGYKAVPQQTTGAIGGTKYSMTPALTPYQPSPIEQQMPTKKFDLGTMLSDWANTLKRVWETLNPFYPDVVTMGDRGGLFSPKPPTIEWEATGPFQRAEGDRGWEYKTPSGTPYNPILKNEEQWEATPFRKFEGYTPTGYYESNEEVIDEILRKPTTKEPERIPTIDAMKFLLSVIPTIQDERTMEKAINAAISRGEYIPIAKGTPTEKVLDVIQNDVKLHDIVKKYIDAGQIEPHITEERLNRVRNGNVAQKLWDNYGYKPESTIEDALIILDEFKKAGRDKVRINGGNLINLGFTDFLDAVSELGSVTRDENNKVIDVSINRDLINSLVTYKKYVDLDVTSSKMNSRGGRVLNGTLKTYSMPKEEEKTKEEELEERQKQANLDYEFYWRPEQVAQRNKQREESWEWSHNKELEGYKEFYEILDELKMSPEMDSYFRDKFNELRRMWETSNSGLDWETWLRQHDFSKDFGKLRPPQRGERPSAFAPRLITVSRQ